MVKVKGVQRVATMSPDKARAFSTDERERLIRETGHGLPDCEPGREPTLHGRCYHCGVRVPDDEVNE